MKEFLDSKLVEVDQDKCKILHLEQKNPISGLSAEENNPMQVQIADWLGAAVQPKGCKVGQVPRDSESLHP